MDATALKRRAVRGVLFLILRTAVIQLCVGVGMVVLARVLTPADFGVYAILQFALTFFQFFGDVGLGAALVRKQEAPTDDEMSSVFTFQCLLSLAVVVLVWIVAPAIAWVWKGLPPGAAWLLRAMSVGFFLTSARVAPGLLMERSLEFGRIAVLDVLQTVSFYVTASALAIAGMGVWTWVGAVLVQGTIGLAGAFAMRPWRPVFRLHWRVLRPLVAFGIPYQLKGIIGLANNAVAPLYAGAVLGPWRLGLINWGQQTAFFPLKLVEVMQRVSFPLYARFQNDPRQFARSVERSVQVSAVGTFFCVALFLAMGPNVTHVVFTDKWLPGLVALYLYSGAIGIGFLSPLIGAAFDALGRPDVFVRLATFWTVLNWVVVPLTTWKWGLEGFVAGNCVHIVIGNIAALVVSKKLLPDVRVLRPLAASLGGGAAVLALGRFWVRGWAWGPGTLTLGILVLAAAHLCVIAVVDGRSTVEAIRALAKKKS